MSLAKKFIAYLELIIPAFFLLSGIVLFSGAYAAKGELPLLGELLIPLTIISVLIVSSFNAFNAVFDHRVDRINKPNRPLPKKSISRNEALFLSTLLYIIAMILSLFVDNFEFRILVLLNILLTIFYSAPNIRLKDSFIITNISIGLQYGVIPLLAGWVLFQSISLSPPLLVFPIFILAMFIGSIKDFGDYAGDRTYKTKTLPVILGPKRAAKLVISLIFLSFIFLILGSLNNLFDSNLALFLAILMIAACPAASKFLKDPIEEGNRFLFISAAIYILVVLGITLTLRV
jgi:4-hydroxybenzoate polyprenyltransferase